MPRKKRKPIDWTTEEVERKLFPKKVVEEVLAAKLAYDKPGAYLHAITNAKAFSPAAQKRAAKEGVKLISRNELLTWPFS